MIKPMFRAPVEYRPDDSASIASPPLRGHPAVFHIGIVLLLPGLGSLACNMGAALNEEAPAATEPQMETPTATEVPPSPTLQPPSATSSPSPTVTPIIVAAVPGYAILTDIDEDDPYYAAAEKLRIYRAAQIDPADSIALSFLRQGALAYVGHMCMWGSNSWPLTLLQALVDDPDITLGEMMLAWYDTAKGPNIIQESAAPDIIGMDNNRFHFAAMVLYGDPALQINFPAPGD